MRCLGLPEQYVQRDARVALPLSVVLGSCTLFRVCPGLRRKWRNCTFFHSMVTLQLFAYPVSDETLQDKTDALYFFSKADADKTVVMVNLGGKFGTFWYGSCTRAM